MKSTTQIMNEATSIHGMLHQQREMNNCLAFLSDKNLHGFIEVGCANGGSFYCWASIIDGPKVSVDLNHGFGLSEGLPGANTFDDVAAAYEATNELVKARNDKWREHYNDVRIVEGNSLSEKTIQKVKDTLNGQTVGWVFIDAWHEYFAAVEDLKNFKQFLSPNGYIGFHDINQSQSMKDFWNEMVRTYDNTITLPEDNGIGIIPAESLRV